MLIWLYKIFIKVDYTLSENTHKTLSVMGCVRIVVLSVAKQCSTHTIKEPSIR